MEAITKALTRLCGITLIGRSIRVDPSDAGQIRFQAAKDRDRLHVTCQTGTRNGRDRIRREPEGFKIDQQTGIRVAGQKTMSLPAGMETSIAGLRRVGSSEHGAVGPDLNQRTRNPETLSRTVRVWTGTSAPGREAPKERAISAVSMEALAEEIHREVRPKVDLEPMDAHPLGVTVMKAYPGLAAGHRWEAVPEGEDPGVEAPVDLPEVLPLAVDLAEASAVSSNLN